MPVLAYLWFARTDQRKWVILCFVVVLVCLGIFSLGLKLSGLSFLPSSILAKYDRSLGVVLGNLLAWPTWITIVFCFFSGQLARRRRLEVWLTLYLPVVMHVVARRTGWFGRYEVAMLAYSLVLSCSYLMEVTRSRAAGLSAIAWRLRVIPAIVFMLLLGFRHLSECTLLTPAAARNIKDQHVQIAIIIRDYFRQPVAVNDLGAVAYFSDRCVLDLFGLGSHEVLRLKRGDAPADQWIASLMQRKGVRAAIVYDPWFPVRPSTWIRVATLTLPSPKITPAEDRVAFYAVDGETAEDLRSALKSYLKDHPSYRQSLEIELPSSI